MHIDKPLILASSSIRRKELLSFLHIPFKVIPSNIDESIDINGNIEEEIKKLSLRKATAVYENHKNCIVIGSDTVAVVDDKVYGKPKSREDAKNMIMSYIGRWHKVVTGIAVLGFDEPYIDVSVTRVKFIDMTEKEVEEYLDTKNYEGKAGGYAIQEESAKYIECIDGDFYTIVGFPLSKVYKFFYSKCSDKE